MGMRGHEQQLHQQPQQLQHTESALHSNTSNSSWWSNRGRAWVAEMQRREQQQQQ